MILSRVQDCLRLAGQYGNATYRMTAELLEVVNADELYVYLVNSDSVPAAVKSLHADTFSF